MVPKHKSSHAGNSDMPKRAVKCFLLSEKVKVLDLTRKEKSTMLRLVKSIARMNLLSIKL
jgi:hypothetical protein